MSLLFYLLAAQHAFGAARAGSVFAFAPYSSLLRLALEVSS
ncbi:hypothetical protein [Methylibium sp.]|nr:hypothetical protein [Methylibium sp.]